MHMERNVKIKLTRTLFLYGKLSGSLRQPLCIIVHGLPGSMDEDFYHLATRWFGKHGFSTFRFNLYGYQKNARQLMHCSLKTHGSDLDAVVHYFRKRGARKVFVAGHSFGGLTILSSHDQNFDAAALWDPSYKFSFTKTKRDLPGGKYIKSVNGYLMRWGTNVIIGKQMVEEINLLPWDSIAKNFLVPFQIIIAEKGLLGSAKKYLNGAKVKTDLVIVKGATHCFNDREGMRDDVFKATKRWFRNYVQ